MTNALTSARFAKDKAAKLPPLFEQRHQHIRQGIERSIDLVEMAKTLDRLKLLGMPAQQAACFMAQAEALNALLRTENNRLHGY